MGFRGCAARSRRTAPLEIQSTIFLQVFGFPKGLFSKRPFGRRRQGRSPILVALLLLQNIHTDVLAQNLGDDDGAVCGLILLDQRGQDTGGCQAGAVERVNELGLAVGALDADVTAAAGTELAVPSS